MHRKLRVAVQGNCSFENRHAGAEASQGHHSFSLEFHSTVIINKAIDLSF
jgi:hypothetical protein